MVTTLCTLFFELFALLSPAGMVEVIQFLLKFTFNINTLINLLFLTSNYMENHIITDIEIIFNYLLANYTPFMGLSNQIIACVIIKAMRYCL